MTPLHLMMLLHHNGIVTPYAENDPQHGNSPAVKEYTQDLLTWGLIELWPNQPYRNPYRTTTRGRAHVEALRKLKLPEARVEWVSE